MVDQSALETLFAYTPGDLTANRSGQLSQRQIHVLSAEQDWAVAGAAASTVALGFLFLSLILYFVIVPALGPQLGAATCLIITAWITLSLICAQIMFTVTRGLLHRRMRRREFASRLRQRMRNAVSGAGISLPTARVERKAGLLTLQSDGEHEYVFLDDIELANSVSDADDRLWQLEPGQRYAVYSVEGPGWIVAVERLDEPATS